LQLRLAATALTLQQEINVFISVKTRTICKVLQPIAKPEAEKGRGFQFQFSIDLQISCDVTHNVFGSRMYDLVLHWST